MPDTTTAITDPHELLIAVRNVIRDNPERHDQGTWIGNVWGDTKAPAATYRKYAMAPVPETPADTENPVCGTTACVAGWAVILGETNHRILQTWGLGTHIHERAMELLDLSDWQADYLFAGYLHRTDVLSYLDALIEDPYADRYDDDDDDDDE